MSSKMLGLDLGAATIKVAQCQVDGPNTTVEKIITRPVPAGAIDDGRIQDPAAVSAVLASIVEDEELDTLDTVVGLNASSGLVIDTVVAPNQSPETLQESLPNLLVAEDRVMGETMTLLQHRVVGVRHGSDGKKRLDVRYFQIDDEGASEVGLVAERAGLRVIGAEPVITAAMRAVALPTHGVNVLIDIGASNVSMLVHERGIPEALFWNHEFTGAGVNRILMRDATWPQGTEDLDVERHKLAEHTHTDLTAELFALYANALTGWITTTLSSHLARRGSGQISHVQLMGGGSYLPGVAQSLRDIYETVTWAQPSNNITVAGDLAIGMHMPAIALATAKELA